MVARLRKSYQVSNGVLVVAVSGRVDSSTSNELAEAFRRGVRQHGPVAAVIGDLDGMSRISSAGLGAVLRTAKWLRSQETKFALCGVNGNARSVFAVSGFDRIIRMFPSRAQALSAMQGQLKQGDPNRDQPKQAAQDSES